MFAHQEIGKIQIIKSPHLPCALYEVVIFGWNFIIPRRNNLIKIKKYIVNKKVNQNHHQYCQWVKLNIVSLLLFGKVN
jgi:hypothetical protein